MLGPLFANRKFKKHTLIFWCAHKNKKVPRRNHPSLATSPRAKNSNIGQNYGTLENSGKNTWSTMQEKHGKLIEEDHRKNHKDNLEKKHKSRQNTMKTKKTIRNVLRKTLRKYKTNLKKTIIKENCD